MVHGSIPTQYLTKQNIRETQGHLEKALKWRVLSNARQAELQTGSDLLSIIC